MTKTSHFLYKISLKFFQCTGLLPITYISSCNRFQHSASWQVFSSFVSVAVILSLFTRLYIYVMTKDAYKYQETLISQTIAQFEPICSLFLLFCILWSNCRTSNITGQATFINNLMSKSTQKITFKDELIFLLKTVTPYIILFVIVVVRYVFGIEELQFVERIENCFSLLLSWFLVCQRAKFWFLLQLILVELKNFKNRIVSFNDEEINDFKRIIKAWQLFEKIFRPLVRAFLLFNLFCFSSGCKSLQDLIMLLLSGDKVNVDEIVNTYWNFYAFPIFIWILRAGQGIEDEVNFIFFFYKFYEKNANF